MKKTLLSLVAIAALGTAAAPAAAQNWRDHGGHDRGRDNQGQSPTAYADSFDWKINHAVDVGVISQRDAQRLRWQVNQVKRSAWRIQTGQAGGGERQRFYDTLGRVDAMVSQPPRYANRDYRDYRGHGYNR